MTGDKAQHQGPSVGAQAAALDTQIVRMRRLLDAMAAASAAERLRALRAAFPEATLDDRIRALTTRH